MNRRRALVWTSLVLGVSGLGGLFALDLAGDAARPHASSPTPPSDASSAILSAAPRGDPTADGARSAPAPDTASADEPLVPTLPPRTSPPSGVRRLGRRPLFVDPIRDRNFEGFTLTRYPADGLPSGDATLTVTVVDADGDPVKGAQVALAPPAGASDFVSHSDRHWVGATDAAGTLRVEALPSGPAVVEVFAFSASVGHPSSSVEVTMPATGGLVLPVRLDRSAARLGRVVGRLVDDAGLPIVDAYVGERTDATWDRTDATGTFRLEHLDPGPTSIVARPPGCATVTSEVEVKPGTETTVELRAAYDEPGTEEIRGRVVGSREEPVAGAIVHFRRASDVDSIRRAITDARGAFVLRRMPSTLGEHGGEVVAFHANGPPESLEVAEFPTSELTITLWTRPPRAKLSVRVVDAASDRAVTRCLVVAWRGGTRVGRSDLPDALLGRVQGEPGTGGVRLESRERGGLLTASVVPGPYRLTVESPEFEPWQATVHVAEPPAETRVPDVRLVRRRAPVEDVTLTVHVTLEGGDGPPARWPDTEIEILDPVDGSRIARSISGSRLAGGRAFTLFAFSGDSRLRVNVAGYATLNRPLRLPALDPEPWVMVRLSRE